MTTTKVRLHREEDGSYTAFSRIYGVIEVQPSRTDSGRIDGWYTEPRSGGGATLHSGSATWSVRCVA